MDEHAPQLAIVNTNWQTSNIVSLTDPDTVERIIGTLGTCSELLASHCGPLAGYAMLVSDQSLGEDKAPSLFTRDGIRVISAVKFMAPIERYIKNLLAYIGSRVDSVAKDGTTTSMFWSCEFLRELLTRRLNATGLRKSNPTNLTVFHVNKAINEIFAAIHVNINASRKTFDELSEGMTSHEKAELAGKIAFMQALSSSGGNIELASAMQFIFERSPRSTWDYITYSFAGRENAQQFYIRRNAYDYRLACVPLIDNTLNKALNTEYEEENVICLVCQGNIVSGTSALVEIPRLFSAIGEHKLLIVAPMADASLTHEVNAWNVIHGDQITIWQYAANEQQNGKAYNWALRVLPAIAGCRSFDPSRDTFVRPAGNGTNETVIDAKPYIFVADKVHFHDKFLEFYGIVDGVDEATSEHPYYAHPELATDYYTEMLTEVKHLLADKETSHDKSNKAIAVYTEVLNQLTTVRRPSLQIGGTTHDQPANAEVAQDVLGAIMSTLTKGFICDGILTIYEAVYTTFKDVSNSVCSDPDNERAMELHRRQHDFKMDILLALRNSLTKVVDTVYDTFPSYEGVERNTDIYHNALVYGDSMSFKSYLGDIPPTSVDHAQLDEATLNTLVTTYPVLQPVTISHEILNRIFELIIKFVITNKIVVEGGVVVNKENSDGGR